MFKKPFNGSGTKALPRPSGEKIGSVIAIAVENTRRSVSVRTRLAKCHKLQCWVIDFNSNKSLALRACEKVIPALEAIQVILATVYTLVQPDNLPDPPESPT
jgi:hypothetical protein